MKTRETYFLYDGSRAQQQKNVTEYSFFNDNSQRRSLQSTKLIYDRLQNPNNGL
jgi:hypothetical protein